MDLHRIATRVLRRFTAAQLPESLYEYQDVMKVLTAIRTHGADLVALVNDGNLSGPALQSADELIQAFIGQWGPTVKDMESANRDLKLQVGDQVVANRPKNKGTMPSPRMPG
jgi:hypothetical protein